jgi:predicted Ser/Thr protein kinase
VGCLSENTIQELVAGALSGDARAQAHRHIETCAACRTLVVELARDAGIEAHGAARATATTELAARVPTATATATATEGAAEPVGATLGRYRIEREIGAGAMGVVHAAFDPNLQRRIALKVLRGTATFEARDRLLREARAMARLTHPNVVTVYEVSSTEGRDFVAMELIHGETLAEWLRKARRTPAAILDAFLAAGRGLAAAHAAGIVHRDFKPHNVLRSRAGRIVVTDFGLAREAESQVPALDTTLVGAESRPPSALAGITVTGSLLGTPAYMAPEQWQGGAITRATDQFAFCVALWEALSGERPYRGPTFDDLKRQVASGPAALDASRIPRRVRGLLRRGLDPDPAKRWPSMDALLERLQRARLRPGRALAITGGALIAALALVFALRPGAPPSPACEPPARDVAMVWSPAIAAELRAKTSEAHAAALDAAFRDWQGARTAACSAPPQVRQAQLSCLDGVLGRFDVLRQAYLRVPDGPAEDLQASLVDPAVCKKPAVADVPRLTLAPTQAAIAAYALLGRSQTEHKPSEAEIAGLAGAATPDPCARVLAAIAFDTAFQGVARARSTLAGAAGAADQCGDERVRADLMIQDNPYHWERPRAGPKADAAIQQARIAASRVMQPELEAALASLSRRVAGPGRGQWDEAFRLTEIELAGYRGHGLETRQLGTVIARNALRIARAEPDDLRAIAGDVRVWRPVAIAHHRLDLARQLDTQDARARLQLGDVASAHTDLIHLWLAQPPTKAIVSRRITGEVVDRDGRPVAGATVAASGQLFADAAGIGLPLFADDVEHKLRIVTSDAAGRFAIEDGAWEGAVVAQLADRRSKPVAIADRVKLVLEPTRSVTGKVNLAGTPHTRVTVHCVIIGDLTGRFDTIAPVGPDGSFVIDGATVGALRLGASTHGDADFDEHIEYRSFPALPRLLTGVALELPSSARVIDVIVHSAVTTPLDGGLVILVSGKPAITSMGDLVRLPNESAQVRLARPVTGDNVPRALLDRAHSGDLIAHIEHARLGDLTACAVNFSGDLMDPEFQQHMQAHFSQLAFKCAHIGPNDAVVELLVPPQQRFD